MSYAETLETFATLQPQDRVEVTHEVKVGFRKWYVTTTGTVVGKDRRRHGLHYQRNFDDKAFSDVLILRRDDGELTTITIDEFTELRKVPSSTRDGTGGVRSPAAATS
jgi:ribosomal protein L34